LSLDPDSQYGSGSTKSLNPDPIRIRIHNPVVKYRYVKEKISGKFAKCTNKKNVLNYHGHENGSVIAQIIV
jgi:hypothetical protein